MTSSTAIAKGRVYNDYPDVMSKCSEIYKKRILHRLRDPASGPPLSVACKFTQPGIFILYLTVKNFYSHQVHIILGQIVSNSNYLQGCLNALNLKLRGKRDLIFFPVDSIPLKGIDKIRQLDVVHAQSLTIVRGERHLDPVVHVEPLRVVVHLVGLDGHPRHESEGLVEVLKGEGLRDGVPAAVDRPPAAPFQKRGEMFAPGGGVQFGRHLSK